MAYPKKVLTVRPTKGLVLDLPPNEVGPDFWTAGSNVQFRDGFAQRVGGYTEIYDGTQDLIKGLLNAQSGGSNYWLYFGDDTIYAASTGTHTDITPTVFTGTTKANQWTLSVLNGIPVACNGIDPPIYWDFDPLNKMQTLPGWTPGTVAGGIRAHRYNLFAYNVQKTEGTFPEQILWSNSAEPGAIPTSWTAAATNDAGDTILAETPGSIVEAAGLRSSMVFYKQHSCYAADFVGGNEVYSFRKLFATTGTLSKNCVAEHNGMHYLFGDGDIFMTDGNTGQSIVDSRMRRFIFNQLDSSNYESVFVAKYTAKDEVWFCFPTAGNKYCNVALVVDTGSGKALGVRDLPRVSCAATGLINDTATSQRWDDQTVTWSEMSTLWNQQTFVESEDALVIGSPDESTPANSKMYQIDTGDSFDGTEIVANVGKHHMAFDDPTRVKFVRRVTPHIDAADGTEVSFRIGSSSNSQGPITWATTQTYTVGGRGFIDTLIQGKFISIEFFTTGGAQWTISSFEVEAELRGYI